MSLSSIGSTAGAAAAPPSTAVASAAPEQGGAAKNEVRDSTSLQQIGIAAPTIQSATGGEFSVAKAAASQSPGA